MYILTNPTMPNLVKIGMTTITVKERVRSLNRSTSLPAEFVVAGVIETTDPRKLEKALHSKYESQRLNKKREFFTMKAEDVVTAQYNAKRWF
ncbi:GIY-YIG nuclease family protein [Vibrio breoganii]